jgi:starch synthase (maltosyl-transferring)
MPVEVGRRTRVQRRERVAERTRPQRPAQQQSDYVPKADPHRVLQTNAPKPGTSIIGARLWTAPESAPRLAPINIIDVRPNIDGGDFALKRVAGETLRVFADIIKEGHDHIRAQVVVTDPNGEQQRVEMHYDYNSDQWHADIKLDELGTYHYSIESFTDHFDTWRDGISRKLKAGRDVKSELLEGEKLLRDAAKHAKGRERASLLSAALVLADPALPQAKRFAAIDNDVIDLMRKHEAPTDLSTSHKAYPVCVERGRAKMGAWYELFPRSATNDPKKHGTFRQAEKRLKDIREMGFDVVYLPPIHPIGESARKGKNNSENAKPGDVGSPWAIGNKHGGHDAIHPELGSVEDFVHFVKETQKNGMEVALDFAVQCAPDHPWVKEHPDWFKRRPDGTIQYAENPPKVYQDIVQLDMWGEKREEMWHAIKDVMDTWIDRGVKIFRVDNPHTKPPAFWQWLIHEVHQEHPDVVFLSEAFTRPKKQDLYAKLGFSQSYSYFTWKNTRHELESFMKDMLASADYLRPNFFANTPDILPEYLQNGGRAAFEIRYALAATLSPVHGIYSGFELCENEALKGEDYLNSEKYEIRPRDYDAPGNIKEWIAKINYIVHANACLHEMTNLKLHNPDNQNVMAYSKGDILVVANLDPHNTQESTVHLEGAALGLDENSKFKVRDLISGEVFDWNGLHNFVKLDPKQQPVHVFRVEKE